MYSEIKALVSDNVRKIDLTGLMKPIQFRREKAYLYAVSSILKRQPNLEEEHKELLVGQIMEGKNRADTGSLFTDEGKWTVLRKAWSWATGREGAKDELRKAVNAGEKINDLDFYLSLPALSQEPLLAEAATAWSNQYRHRFKEHVESAVTGVLHHINDLQQRALRKQARERINNDLDFTLATLRDEFVKQLIDAAQTWRKTGYADIPCHPVLSPHALQTRNYVF
jgi:hypothetical protein